MKEFIVSVNGKPISVPFIEKVFGTPEAPKVYSPQGKCFVKLDSKNFLTVGSKIADNGEYTYDGLELVINGTKISCPSELQDGNETYSVLDFHNQWPVILAENGLYVVRSCSPLFVFYKAKPNQFWEDELLKKFSLPEFKNRGKLFVVFDPVKTVLRTMFEDELLGNYDKQGDYGKNEVGLYLGKNNRYLYWVDCPLDKVVYWQDRLCAETSDVFIDVTTPNSPLIRSQDDCQNTWGVFFIDNFLLDDDPLKPFYLRAKQLLGHKNLQQYEIVAQLRPPFKKDGKFCFKYPRPGFDAEKAQAEMPQKVLKVIDNDKELLALDF